MAERKKSSASSNKSSEIIPLSPGAIRSHEAKVKFFEEPGPSSRSPPCAVPDANRSSSSSDSGSPRTKTPDSSAVRISTSPSIIDNNGSSNRDGQQHQNRFTRRQIHHEYNMNHGSRGWAYIFNQENFTDKQNKIDPSQQRKGTEADLNKIIKVLRFLGFDQENIRPFTDSTKEEVSARLEALRQEDHTDNDCVVVVFLTHGGEQGVLDAKDGSFNLEDVLTKFQPDSCKSLLGKPKIFIIEACRGKDFDEGVEVDGSHVDEKVPQVLKVPKTGDFLVCYSSSEKYVSIRHPEKGSWYIQTLGKAILEDMDLNRDEFTHVLTSVNRQVSVQETRRKKPNSKEQIPVKQCPCYVSNLLNLLYFRPNRWTKIKDRNPIDAGLCRKKQRLCL